MCPSCVSAATMLMMTAAATSGGLTAFAVNKLRTRTPAAWRESRPERERANPRLAAQRRAEADRVTFELARRALEAEPQAALRRPQWG